MANEDGFVLAVCYQRLRLFINLIIVVCCSSDFIGNKGTEPSSCVAVGGRTYTNSYRTRNGLACCLWPLSKTNFSFFLVGWNCWSWLFSGSYRAYLVVSAYRKNYRRTVFIGRSFTSLQHVRASLCIFIIAQMISKYTPFSGNVYLQNDKRWANAFTTHGPLFITVQGLYLLLYCLGKMR